MKEYMPIRKRQVGKKKLADAILICKNNPIHIFNKKHLKKKCLTCSQSPTDQDLSNDTTFNQF